MSAEQPPLASHAVAAPALPTYKPRTFWSDAWARLRKNKVAMGGLAVLILLALMAIFAPAIAPYPYGSLLPPSIGWAPIRWAAIC